MWRQPASGNQEKGITQLLPDKYAPPGIDWQSESQEKSFSLVTHDISHPRHRLPGWAGAPPDQIPSLFSSLLLRRNSKCSTTVKYDLYGRHEIDGKGYMLREWRLPASSGCEGEFAQPRPHLFLHVCIKVGSLLSLSPPSHLLLNHLISLTDRCAALAAS